MSIVKRFRKCADPCQRYLTSDDAHDLCIGCLGEEHMRSVLKGAFPLEKAPLSFVPFLERIRTILHPPPPRDSISAAAEAARRLRS